MATGGEPSPGAAPALTPQSNRGDQESAHATIQAAMTMLERVLPRFGRDTEEYRAVLGMINAGAKAFKLREDRGRDLLSAEMSSRMMDTTSPQGAPPPTPAGGGGALPPGAQPGVPGGAPPGAGAAPP
jgi:hypothetical protein